MLIKVFRQKKLVGFSKMFTNARNIAYKNTNVGEELDSINENLTHKDYNFSSVSVAGNNDVSFVVDTPSGYVPMSVSLLNANDKVVGSCLLGGAVQYGNKTYCRLKNLTASAQSVSGIARFYFRKA